MYFDIEDENKIGVQFKLLNIFGKHSIVCQNLKLKPEVVNTRQMLVHVQSCKIQHLQIAVDSSKQQLLSAKVNGVHLCLKFNKNVEVSSTNKTLQKPEIQQFKRVISSEQTYEKIKYFERSAFKQMLIEQVLRKTNLIIENVDISLLYSQTPISKYVGLRVGSVDIHQRFVINKKKNSESQNQEEIECKLTDIGIYFGMKADNQTMVRQSYHKQVIKTKQNPIKKRFIAQKNQLLVYYNEGNNTLSVISELIEINLSALYIRQILSIIKQVKPLLSKAPKLRPGKGKKLRSGQYQFSQGTSEWWKYIGTMLVEKIKQKQKYNIIQNRQYRLYLYCLLYCYTYGAEQIYLNYIKDAERYKKTKHIMNSHKFIIEKIYKIQHKTLDPSQQMQLRGFVSFLSMKPKKKAPNSGLTDIKNNFWDQLKKLSQQRSLNASDIKKIKYEDIKKSKVFINFSNCVRFISESERQDKNVISIFFRLKSFNINLIETKQQVKMFKEIYQEHPQHFHIVKKHTVQSYFYEHLKNAQLESTQNDRFSISSKDRSTTKEKRNLNPPQSRQKQFLIILALKIDHFCLENIQNRLALTIAQIKAKQLGYKQKIVDIKNVSFVNSALQKYSEKQGRIVNVGNELQFRLVSLYLNATVKTAQKLLMIYTLIQDNVSEGDKSASQSNNSFIDNFMNKKIVSDAIFNSYQKQSMHFFIQTISLVTPAFDKDKIFQINLNRLECDYPSSGTKTISLERIQLKRTTFQNLKNQSWKKLGQNQSIILQNDRSFTILISQSYTQKIDPEYFNFVRNFTTFPRQNMQKKEAMIQTQSKKYATLTGQSMKQKSGQMIEHDARSCFKLIIPFLFIQLSCADIYYLMIIKKFWTQLLRNPYIFRPKLKTQEALQQANKNENKNSTFQFIKQIQKNTKILYETHITLNGIQFILNGDSSLSDEEQYSGFNRIMTIMIDSISYDTESKLKQDNAKIKIKNVYVRNMLGNDSFNLEALEDVFKEVIEKKQPLIKRKRKQERSKTDLIMYNHYTDDFQTQDKTPFLDITMLNSMNIEKLRGKNDINVQVKAFQIFHEPKFFRCMVEIFSKLDLISGKHYEESRGKFFQKSFIKQNNDIRDYEIEQKLLNQNKEILYSKDFSVINTMNIRLQKVNFIVLLECEPVYCFALDTIILNHKTQSYITVYNINIKQLYIIDVSQTNGPHSILIQSTQPVKINFTQYNCELLRQRYKRSALLKIQINHATIHFLNKKIMEFVSFINQLKEDIFGKPQTNSNKKQNQNDGEYPFCYQIIIIDSNVLMYRNSLSKQKFNAKIGSLSITNFKNKATEQNLKKKTMTNFHKKLSPSTEDFIFKKQMGSTFQKNFRNAEQELDQEPLNQTYYQEMEQVSQNHFKSFVDESIIEEEKNDTIYIDIFTFLIEGRHRQKQILFAKQMHMSFQNIQLNIVVPKIQLCLDNDDFRLLIRLTEQNFGQQDRYFHVNPVFSTEKYEKFVTNFSVLVIRMQCIKGDYGVYEGKDIQNAQKRSEQLKEESMNILNLIGLIGKDVSFINGEKFDEIQIQSIYAEEQNMIPFIERCVSQKNDPIIQVRPQTISRSQEYFNKLKNVFEIFSKLGEEGQLVLSDFDYKEDQILNRPERGRILTMAKQKASKCQQLMKWMRGMCDKCFWWAKKQIDQINPYDIAKHILDRQVQKRRNMEKDMIQEHTLFCNGDYNLSHIFNDKQIIRLENKVSPKTFFPLYNPNYRNQIYFRMDMQTTKQKKMYILAKELALTYQVNKGLLDLMTFFAKPYGPYQDYDPPFVASNFNNFRPIQMYMQLKDSKLQMKKDFIRVNQRNFEKIESTEKIMILLDLIYNMQNMGDLIKGPGKSVKEADVIFQVFHSIHKQGSVQYIELSNLIQIIYRNQATISYKKQDRTKFDQKIILKPYFDKQENVKFSVPAFSLKSLMQIYQGIFSPKPKQQNSQQNIKRQDSNNMEENLQLSKKYSLSPRKNMNMNEDQKKKSKKAQELASKIDEKKQKIKQKDVESSYTNRKIYVKSICFNIQSKVNTSFIKVQINNLMFVNLYQNMIRTQKSKMQLNSQLSIYYWNLHLLEFEPFLEPWNSKLIVKNIKREKTLSKKIKLQSFNKALQVDNLGQHNNNNWLNLNLSTAFFHTYKQLQLKYYQGKDEKQEECFDVTYPQLFTLIKGQYQESKDAILKGIRNPKKKENFPPTMKNFFGRKFIIESQVIRKKSSQRAPNNFHEQGTVYNLYHSYFDHQKRKKTICYRTPYRILNCFNDDIQIKFIVKHLHSTFDEPKYLEDTYIIRKGEYLPLPSLVHKQDFLIQIRSNQGQMQSMSSPKNKPKSSQMLHQNETDKLLEEQAQEGNFISAQYLMQMHSQKSQFKKDKNSRILNKLFSEDIKKQRYLDPRDILIKSGKQIFALVCTKSQYENYKQKSKVQFYDTLVAIVTPIQIYNHCPVPLTVILNGKQQYKLPINKSTYINQDLNIEDIHETVIQFRQHILHRQFTFLKKQNENHTYFMEIDRMQSINVRVIKETTSTFSIEIFADWIIENNTDQQFQLDYGTKVFPIDKSSKNSIAIENYQHGQKIQMELSIYSPDDTRQYPHTIVTNGTQTAQIVTLFKKFPDSQERTKLLDKKKNIKITTKCCFKSYPFNEETQERQTDEIFKVYNFILKISQYEQSKFTKTMSLRYKTKMKNKTNKILILYQYNHNFKIQKLYPDNEICVWSYDFLPQHYLIEKRQLVSQTCQNFEVNDESKPEQIFMSQKFKFDQSMGKMMTIKFKESFRASSNDGQYFRNFSYLKIQINQYDHSSLYEFTEVNINSNDQFPIYIHNTTDENIKIYQNNETFIVKPRSKVPFSWSDLINNTHEIGVQIGDVKKTYSFNQNQQFEPIIVKDQNANRPAILEPKTNFHKEVCRIKYGLIEGKFQTIIDIKQNCLIILAGLEGIEYKFDMKKAVKMTTSAQSIQLNLGSKEEPLIIYPSNETYEVWLSYLNFTINQDVITKISFTIETYKNSRLFFFHNVQLGRQNDYLTSSENYFIENLFVSVINDKPEQVILIHLGEIRFTRQDRVCRLGYEDYQIQKCDKKIEVKEFKISNQLENAVNPVILTQIKKSKTPFISIITKKRNLVKSKQDLEAFEFKDQMITHFESFRFFLDEAQAMIEASLIPKLLNLKNQMQKIQTQYKIEDNHDQQSGQSQSKQNEQNKNQLQKKAPLAQNQKNSQSYQLYLSFLQIRPIKMTVSVSFDKLSEDQEQERLNMQFLNMLPVGIQNAIITIDSYMFHHIYQDKDQVLKQIRQFYTSQLTKQVLLNAGNLQFLVAIDLIKNLGIGVKNIFYDPIYEFASNKDIKNTTSTLLEGLFSFVLLIIAFFVKVANLIFKILAIFTFDTDYKAKRQIFRKQIFKSPVDGAVFGGKYFWKIFRSFIDDLFRLPKQYYQDYSIIGCLLGFILGILNIIPWILKVFITLYDLFYVIGIGVISWGHYEENAMKNRSRPVRVFHKKKLVPYNLLQAKAYEIMLKHNINLTEKQSILYVRDVDNVQKTNSYLILSDYSLLYCDNRLSIFDEIILYKVLLFRVVYPEKTSKRNRKSVFLEISLKSPNVRKFLFIQLTKYTYNIKFKRYEQLLQLLDKLQDLKQKSEHKMTQKYDYEILDDKRVFNKEQIKYLRKKQQPLEYKRMDYLQTEEEVDGTQNAILEGKQFEFQSIKKKQQL